MKEKVGAVWPSGRCVQPQQPLAPRLGTLEGKTICALNNGRYYFNQTWPLVKQLLSQKYSGVRFVDWGEFPIISDDEDEVLKDLAGKLRQYGCDAVISGRGC